jgi:hypothetical protein
MPDPLWINCAVTGGPPEYTAAELRQDMALGGTWGGRSLGARPGVRPGGTQWNVTISGTTITVWAGVGIIDPGLTVSQGPYWVAIPADEAHTITPAHATSPRKDIIVVRVYDHDEDGLGLREARSEYIEGTAAPSPSEPAVPTSAMRIATIDVPALGGGNPVVTQNSPYTVAPGGILPVRSVTEQSAVIAYPGMVIYRTDTGTVHVWSGVAWRELSPEMPYCVLSRSTDQTNAAVHDVWSSLSWNLEVEDPNNLHSTATNPERINIGVKLGLWQIKARFNIEANATGGRGARLVLNAAPLGRSFVPAATGGKETSFSISATVRASAAGDFVLVQGYQNSGSALDFGVTDGGPRVEALWVRN